MKLSPYWVSPTKSQASVSSCLKSGAAIGAIGITILVNRYRFPRRVMRAAALLLRHSMKTKKRKTLCVLCRAASDNECTQAPSHVVHPLLGKTGLYDIYGNAKCPECGAVWHRRRNQAMLVEEISHGRHHR